MPRYAWEGILGHLAEVLSEAAQTSIEASELIAPPKPELGDVAFGCFKIAKTQGKNPAEIASELASYFKSDALIERASSAGPYVNFSLKSGEVIHRVMRDVERYGAEFGASEEGGGRELMLECANPNTHKEIHVGHLRHLVIGPALLGLLRRSGWKVVTASYHGDVGAHVAKCLWRLVKDGAVRLGLDTDLILAALDESTVEKILQIIPVDRRNGNYLGGVYTQASRELADAAVEGFEKKKQQVSDVQRNIERRDPAWIKLWRETRRWSLNEMSATFQELGVSIDRQYLESEVVDEGQRIVDDLLEKGIARESQGAIIVDLEDQGLGVFLVRKSDGASLYATKDLALAQLKLREYPHLRRSLMLVDQRQSFYFQQLFATLRLMGLDLPMEYVGYEFVTLKSGAMSSREGNIVTWQSFRDEVMAFARKETAERHPEWPMGRVEHTAWCLAMGGIKYGMLRQDSDKIFTFDLEQALSFDGDTGPYIQYAATRLSAILKKAGSSVESDVVHGDLTSLSDPTEKRLALQVAAFPVVCSRAAKELRPMLIAQWCFVMAQRVTEFYHAVKVLEASPELRSARLRLVARTYAALKNGLDLLGIPLPDEM